MLLEMVINLILNNSFGRSIIRFIKDLWKYQDNINFFTVQTCALKVGSIDMF